MLVSERVGWFELDDGQSRLEYTEYGSGDRWVVLVHGLLMPRRINQPLARALAEQGLHVVCIDLLGHGRSDRPADPLLYSIAGFGAQVVALLDHLGAEQAVVGGVSLGANVSLEVATLWPERVRGLIIEMPVLNNALDAAVMTFVPLMFAAKYLPWTVRLVRGATRPIPRGLVPFWLGVGLDTLDQRPEPMAAVLHGMSFGGAAPPSDQRRRITAPALVVGHHRDPIHPFADARLLADELPQAEFVQSTSIAEWRINPERLNDIAAGFARMAWSGQFRPAATSSAAASAPSRRRPTKKAAEQASRRAAKKSAEKAVGSAPARRSRKQG